MSLGTNAGTDAARAPAPAAALDWSHDALAQLAARFVDAGGLVAEVDSLTGGAIGAGRGGLPERRLVLAPFEYVRAILAAGLEIEGESAERIAGATLAGADDFDYAPVLSPFAARFNAPGGERLRVRTLDRLLEALPQPKLLLLGGHGLRADILRGGRGLFAAGAPVIVARPDSPRDFARFAAALRESAPDYEWTAPAGGGLAGAGARPYYVALAGGPRGEDARRLLQRDADGPAAVAPPGARLASLHVKPDAFIASNGFYGPERSPYMVWRWGGAAARLSALLEAPAPGLYEIRIMLANSIPGAAEGVTQIRVNGAVAPDIRREGVYAMTVAARVGRPILLEIDCGVRRIVPPDLRTLSLSLAQIVLTQIAA